MQGSEAVTEQRMRRVDGAFLVATIALSVAWCARLALQMRGAMFGTDECFHAYVSRWILEHGRLPDAFPGLYGGFDYYYQPLLHLAGAIVAGLFGESGLRFMPLAFSAGTLLVVAFGALAAIPRHARIWGVLLCLLSGLLATYAVRLYVESLVALLITASALALVDQQRSGGRASTFRLGVLVGFALLTKFTGWALVGLLIVVALWRLVRGDAERARGLGAALCISLLVAAPWLIRNQLLFGSALYPVGAPDLDRELYALHRAHFSISPGTFLRGLPDLLGPFMLAINAMALLGVALERRWALREGLWLFSVAGVVATAFVPMAAARHVTAFLPLLALTASWVVAEALARRGLMVRPVALMLIVAAGLGILQMPDHRATANPPAPLLAAFEAIERVTPERSNILCLWTYDSFYYGHRPATWPVPWGQARSPIELFRTGDPDVFAAAMDSLGIDYVLAPQSAPLEPWNGSNYPESFIGCVRALVERGDLQMAWQSDRVVLLRRGP
jgi:hypothetical protein